MDKVSSTGLQDSGLRKEVRLLSLDGVRGLSILIVVLGHIFLPERGGLAALGVYLFFALSGYLITGILLKEIAATGNVNIGGFLIRRAWRLTPALVVFILIVVGFYVSAGLTISWLEISSALTYTTNYLGSYLALKGDEFSMPLGVLWSLAVEEHFYLLFPILLVFCRFNPARILASALVVIAGCLVIRNFYYFAFPESIGKLLTYRNSDSRFDSISVGVVLAILLHRDWCAAVVQFMGRQWVVLVSLLLMVVLAMIPGQYYRETLRFSLLSLVCVPVITFGALNRVGWLSLVLRSKPLLFFGNISYSLYIWHIACIQLTHAVMGNNHSFATGCVALLSSVLAGWCSYEFVEKRFLSIRRRRDQSIGYVVRS